METPTAPGSPSRLDYSGTEMLTTQSLSVAVSRAAPLRRRRRLREGEGRVSGDGQPRGDACSCTEPCHCQRPASESSCVNPGLSTEAGQGPEFRGAGATFTSGREVFTSVWHFTSSSHLFGVLQCCGVRVIASRDVNYDASYYQ